MFTCNKNTLTPNNRLRSLVTKQTVVPFRTGYVYL